MKFAIAALLGSVAAQTTESCKTMNAMVYNNSTTCATDAEAKDLSTAITAALKTPACTSTTDNATNMTQSVQVMCTNDYMLWNVYDNATDCSANATATINVTYNTCNMWSDVLYVNITSMANSTPNGSDDNNSSGSAYIKSALVMAAAALTASQF